MRRTQFITAAIVAVITFASLQAFVGPRYPGYWGWNGGHWYGRHGHYAPYYDAPGYNYRRYDWRNYPPPAQPAYPPGADSAGRW